MFFQYLPKILNQNPKSILLICDRRLVSLFKRSLPEIEVRARHSDGDMIASQVPSNSEITISLASIGMSCIHDKNDIPFSPNPWLKADLKQTLSFQSYINERAAGKIPIAFGCWSAGIQGKSIPPEEFLLPFRGLTDRFCFVNVQGFPAGDTKRPQELLRAFNLVFGQENSINCPIDLWNDIDGTAALLQAVKNLNGIAIMIPNYTEMVVCGIGMPHYKPLHADYVFKYGAGRVWNEDCFIYPTTQTFLQDVPGDWSGPLQCIAKELENFVPEQKAINPIRHDRMQFKPASVEDLLQSN